MSPRSLSSACGVCNKKENLQPCDACRVMMYCSEDHQADHRPLHESACNEIERRRNVLERKAHKLSNHPGEFVLASADPSEHGPWSLAVTRNYMRACLGLIQAMAQIVTVESVQEQLEYLMDMLQMCRSDNLSVRILVPSLMLRLDQDQECYDFLKWWAVATEDFTYEWEITDSLYLNIRSANVFESLDVFNKKFRAFTHLVCLVLLKIKLLFDLIRLQQAEVSLRPRAPREIIDMILPLVPQSPIVKAQCIRMDGHTRAVKITTLQVQVDILFKYVSIANKYFWTALSDHSGRWIPMPEFFAEGSVEESQVALKATYDAWIETPGAIEFVKAKLEGKD